MAVERKTITLRLSDGEYELYKKQFEKYSQNYSICEFGRMLVLAELKDFRDKKVLVLRPEGEEIRNNELATTVGEGFYREITSYASQMHMKTNRLASLFFIRKLKQMETGEWSL